MRCDQRSLLLSMQQQRRHGTRAQLQLINDVQANTALGHLHVYVSKEQVACPCLYAI